MDRFRRFLLAHKTIVLSLGFLVLFSVTVSYATPPSSPFAPGSTLDPSCAPGETNCTVTVSPWTVTGNDTYYNAGNVGIGTSTPSAALEVVGEAKLGRLSVLGVSSTIDAPASAQAAITLYDPSVYAYAADGKTLDYRVYSYKVLGGDRIYSASYADASVSDDSSGNTYAVDLSWSQVNDADGYRILQQINGAGFNEGYDITDGATTSFTDGDDGSSHFSYNSPDIIITPTTAYTNTSTFNGSLSVDGSVTVGGRMTVSGATNFSGSIVATDQNAGIAPDLGAGTRMMWIPSLAAFRVGSVDSNQWDSAYVGQYSTAFGRNNVAYGQNSLAFGNNTLASGSASVAFGDSSQATGNMSTAFGYSNTVSGNGATAFGSQNQSTGDQTTAFGYQTQATGSYATSFGYNTVASGYQSLASGQSTTASGFQATAFGESTTASGGDATAFGYNTIASGGEATAFGSYTKAESSNSLAIGSYNIGGGDPTSWVGTDSVFEIGNGTDDGNRSNALTVLKNGNVGIGTATPIAPLEVAGLIKSTQFALAGVQGATPLDAPANLQADLVNDGTPVVPFAVDFNYKVYAYKVIGGNRIYSAGFATLDQNLHVDSITDHYHLDLTWDPVAGADGYRILLYSVVNGSVSQNYDHHSDVDTNSYSNGVGSPGPAVVNGGDVTPTQLPSLDVTGASLFTGEVSVTGNTDITGLFSVNGGISNTGSTVSGTNSIAFGDRAVASGNYSVAIGSSDSLNNGLDFHPLTASGQSSAAFGRGSLASGDISFVAGSFSDAIGDASAAFGVLNVAEGAASFAQGQRNVAHGLLSSVFGSDNVAASDYSTVFGIFNVNTTSTNQSWTGTDSLFEIGNGTTSNSRSNALTILKNGNVGITASAPAYLLTVGDSTVADGIIAHFETAGATCDLDPTDTGGLVCTSDMNAKKNITVLGDGSPWSFGTMVAADNQTMLAKVLALTPVQYNFNAEADSTVKHTGFIAQDVEQLFPDLVSTDPHGKKSLNYVGLLPYTVQAVKEMSLNITDIANLDRDNSWRDALTAWFGNASNHITRIFTGEICLSEAGQESECLNRSELKQLKTSLHEAAQQQSGGSSSAPAPEVQTPEVQPEEVVPEQEPVVPEAPAEDAAPAQ